MVFLSKLTYRLHGKKEEKQMKDRIRAAYEAAKSVGGCGNVDKEAKKVPLKDEGNFASNNYRLYGDVLETMRKERMGQSIVIDSISITIDRGVPRFAVAQAKYGPNRETRLLEQQTLIYGEHRECPVVVLLTIDSEAVKKGGARAIFARLCRNQGEDEWFCRLPGDNWRDQSGNITSVEADANVVRRFYGGDRVNVATSSPGMVKKGQLMLRCINWPGYSPERDLDKITFGLYSELQNHPRVATDASEVSKMSTRLGQFMAGSVDTKQVGTFCVFAGKFKDEAGDEYADGDLSIDSRYAAEIVNAYMEESGSALRFSEVAALGRGFQCRPWNCKTMGVVRSTAFIDLFLKKQVNNKKWQYICRKNVSPEQQKQFNMLFGRNKKDSAYYDKLVVIGDESSFNGKIDVLTDLNGLKATFDLHRESGLNILQQTHDEVQEERASDSTQLVPAFGGGLNSAKDVRSIYTIERLLTREEARSKAKKFEDGRTPSVLEPEDIPTTKDGRRIFRAAVVLDKVAPSYKVKYDRGFYKEQANECLGSLAASIRCFKHRFSGSYYKIAVDPAHYLGFDVLRKAVCEDGIGRIEIVTNNPVAAKLWTVGKHLNGVVKRYPGAATNELALAQFVSVDEYCQRIDKMKERGEITADQCELVKEAVIAQAAAGLCMIPADAGVLRKLGGADFDGDGVVVIAAVSMAAKIIVHQIEKSGSTEIQIGESVDKPITTGVDLALDEAVCRRALENFISSGIPDVGKVISRHNLFKEATVRALTDPKSVLEFWRSYVVPALKVQVKNRALNEDAVASEFEHEHDVDGDIVRIDAKAIDSLCVSGIKASTPEEILACAKDFDYAARLFAEKSIDAAKKLFEVNCHYLDGLTVGLLGKESEEDAFKLIVDWDK